MLEIENFTPSKFTPYGYAKTQGGFVKSVADGVAELYMREGASLEAISEILRIWQGKYICKQVSPVEYDKLLTEVYSQQGASNAFAEDIENNLDLSSLIQELPKVEDLLEAEGDAPIIRMINAIFTQALREGASDIHIEPYETKSVVRFRIDGTLRNIVEPHRALHAALISRIKVMAQMDIAEKRLPQDGRLTLKIAGKLVDIRVSTLPTGHGERVVLRILEKDAKRLSLSRLGMSEKTELEIDALVRQPHGIFLVTGPTGSGKTTTLYSALSRLDANVLNIMTVEDPIEYDLPHISQTQVNAKIDMSFAKALRSILRQDPDAIMIGEIRDVETAQIAVQSSLTGHLVLATLHTNDAVSAVTRLVDMGIEPFLLASSLSGVLAQRLVRCLCKDCRVAYEPDSAELALMNISPPPQKIYRAAGCESCGGTGYKGRIGIYELLTIDDEIRHLVHDKNSEQLIRAHANVKGMQDLRQDGMRWIESGVTSLEELLTVTKE
ncbi:MAG: type II secretion system ATPase GspE [Methylophilus sp.]|jgi:general secretion pathway protein E